MQPGQNNDVPLERQSPVEMSPEAFRRVGHRLVDDLAEFLGSLPEIVIRHGREQDARLRPAL